MQSYMEKNIFNNKNIVVIVPVVFWNNIWILLFKNYWFKSLRAFINYIEHYIFVLYDDKQVWSLVCKKHVCEMDRETGWKWNLNGSRESMFTWKNLTHF